MRPPRPSRAWTFALAVVLGLLWGARAARAGPPIDFSAEALLYGDNTEFFNPYRTGETTLGGWARLFFAARLGQTVELRAGVFGNERFGSEDSFELVRPVLSLRVGSPRGRLVFGTLETVRPAGGGPDRTTLHGLLPPLQRETLAFTRPHENGVQWLLDTPRVTSDLWLNWQKLNTPEHREVLDAGVAGRVALTPLLSLGLQGHVVHHGGQLYDVGPVSDSYALGPGVAVTPPLPFLDRFTVELYGLYAKDKANRERPDLTTSGRAAFLRVAGEKAGWRGHLILWRARDFVKEEGDGNYLSRSEDGSFYRATRTYAELGASRLFTPAPGVALEASARLHRVDSAVEYSYRLVGRVSFDLPVVK